MEPSYKKLVVQADDCSVIVWVFELQNEWTTSIIVVGVAACAINRYCSISLADLYGYRVS